ncbi:hypothetical protein WN48_09697 [Eufriesea mexicana]|uniref:Uncharacterized protein n=1 Tax=Eufriesea mexicana TaxID=516756 RepID=A0A310SLC6_9HYME|nr:hypothetical protein WN48_09697 [Eufriesea mexicana]
MHNVSTEGASPGGRRLSRSFHSCLRGADHDDLESELTYNELQALLRQAINETTPNDWRRFCKHVETLGHEYWAKDGIIEDATEDLELKIQSSESDKESDDSSSKIYKVKKYKRSVIIVEEVLCKHKRPPSSPIPKYSLLDRVDATCTADPLCSQIEEFLTFSDSELARGSCRFVESKILGLSDVPGFWVLRRLERVVGCLTELNNSDTLRGTSESIAGTLGMKLTA